MAKAYLELTKLQRELVFDMIRNQGYAEGVHTLYQRLRRVFAHQNALTRDEIGFLPSLYLYVVLSSSKSFFLFIRNSLARFLTFSLLSLIFQSGRSVLNNSRIHLLPTPSWSKKAWRFSQYFFNSEHWNPRSWHFQPCRRRHWKIEGQKGC